MEVPILFLWGGDFFFPTEELYDISGLSSLDLRFWGAPILSPEAPKTHLWSRNRTAENRTAGEPRPLEQRTLSWALLWTP